MSESEPEPETECKTANPPPTPNSEDAPSLYKAHLLPVSKFDEGAIEYLMTASEYDLTPLVDDLLQWIADPAWPIAWVIPDLLLRVPWALVSAISNVLLMHIWSGYEDGQPIEVDITHDHMLHDQVLRRLVARMPVECVTHLEDDLKLYLETMVTDETDESYGFRDQIRAILAQL